MFGIAWGVPYLNITGLTLENSGGYILASSFGGKLKILFL